MQMPSLLQIQDALRSGNLRALSDELAAGDKTAALVGAALRMEQDLLAAHPGLAFPILYDRLIWEHGPS